MAVGWSPPPPPLVAVNQSMSPLPQLLAAATPAAGCCSWCNLVNFCTLDTNRILPVLLLRLSLSFLRAFAFAFGALAVASVEKVRASLSVALLLRLLLLLLSFTFLFPLLLFLGSFPVIFYCWNCLFLLIFCSFLGYFFGVFPMVVTWELCWPFDDGVVLD